jgi:hypothetical protein
MTDGNDRARESWAIYLVDGALAASERSGGPHLYHFQSPHQVALFRQIASRALWYIPHSVDEGSKPGAMRHDRKSRVSRASGLRRATMPVKTSHQARRKGAGP